MSQQAKSNVISRRTFLKRSAFIGGLAGMAALAGCAAPATSGTGGGAEPGAVSWEVVYWKPPHSAKAAEVWEPLLQRFMDANPGITVDHQVIPWGNVDEQFTAAFAGGEPPDVFYLPDEWYPKYVNQDQILDLTDRIVDWEDNYIESAWNIATYKGSTWGAPFLGVVQGWLLNMNLFNEKGLGIPTNWEEFRNAASEMNDTDAGTYGVNVPASSTNWVTMIPLLAAGGAQLLSDDLTTVTANTEGGQAAFRALLEEITFEDQSSIPVGFTADQRRALGFSGKIGMTWVENSGIKAQWRTEAPDLELATIPMLQLTEDGKNASWANIGFMFMASSSADNDGAFKLLEYLSTDEIQVDYVQKSVDLLPLKKSIAPLDDIDPIVNEMISWLASGYGVGTQISIRWRDATNSLVQESHAVMSGLKTAEQALSDVETTVNPVLDGQ
jgi:ABC-type glycerol-3-phosphate transport system substrate-binding protein